MLAKYLKSIELYSRSFWLSTISTF